jgi:DNA invertase Pin-like site-specific DNA recombinase
MMTDAANGNGKEKKTAWWEIPPADVPPAAESRAVGYYRHSAQDRQENSIPIQQDQVREWAEKNGVEIIKEFADAGRSGLTAEGHPAFTEMMEEWVKKRDDFRYVLCLDVSRFGRFQDIDLSAQYSAECTRNGKKVVYTTIGLPRENDSFQPVYVHFERFRAAEYSKELSVKVWQGCMKIAEQGYWAGGSPPYGLRRLLLDEKREPVHVMEPGQRKSIQNQRITLVQGDPAHVAVLQRMSARWQALGEVLSEPRAALLLGGKALLRQVARSVAGGRHRSATCPAAGQTYPPVRQAEALGDVAGVAGIRTLPPVAGNQLGESGVGNRRPPRVRQLATGAGGDGGGPRGNAQRAQPEMDQVAGHRDDSAAAAGWQAAGPQSRPSR